MELREAEDSCAREVTNRWYWPDPDFLQEDHEVLDMSESFFDGSFVGGEVFCFEAENLAGDL